MEIESEVHLAEQWPVDPLRAAAAYEQLAAEQKHTILNKRPDGLGFQFTTRKSMWSFELVGQLDLMPVQGGCGVNLVVDVKPGRPKGLIEKRKNARLAQKILDGIKAKVGS